MAHKHAHAYLNIISRDILSGRDIHGLDARGLQGSVRTSDSGTLCIIVYNGNLVLQPQYCTAVSEHHSQINSAMQPIPVQAEYHIKPPFLNASTMIHRHPWPNKQSRVFSLPSFSSIARLLEGIWIGRAICHSQSLLQRLRLLTHTLLALRGWTIRRRRHRRSSTRRLGRLIIKVSFA